MLAKPIRLATVRLASRALVLASLALLPGCFTLLNAAIGAAACSTAQCRESLIRGGAQADALVATAIAASAVSSPPREASHDHTPPATLGGEWSPDDPGAWECTSSMGSDLVVSDSVESAASACAMMTGESCSCVPAGMSSPELPPPPARVELTCAYPVE